VFQVGGERKVDCLATILGYDLAENYQLTIPSHTFLDDIVEIGTSGVCWSSNIDRKKHAESERSEGH
jgi:hypothetical protein